jgi:hypothetical protein
MINKLLTSIPLSRLLFYLFFLLLLPFLFLFFDYSAKLKKVDRISSHLEKTTSLFLEKERKQAVNKVCRKQFANKERYALEKELEKISPLKREREEIERVVRKNAFLGNGPLEERLLFLNGKANRLLFTEAAATAKMGVQETVEALSHPVEVDANDLKHILKVLDGYNPSFPQSFITDFQLTRTRKATGGDVFLLNLKLVKREFL